MKVCNNACPKKFFKSLFFGKTVKIPILNPIRGHFKENRFFGMCLIVKELFSNLPFQEPYQDIVLDSTVHICYNRLKKTSELES